MPKIGNIEVNGTFMNAACAVAKTIEDVQAYAQTSAGAILVGSITLEAREGNAEPRWFVGDGYALNSFGMPNGGLEHYKEVLPDMIKIAHDANKVFVLDIAGFSTDDYVKLASMAEEVGVDLLELNLGCPNIRVDGEQKPIVSFDRETMTEIIDAVSAVCSKPLILKLSPYSNPGELKAVAETINQSGKVAAVSTMNTMPNGYMSKDGSPVISMTFAGVSGRAIQPIALGQVKQFRDSLNDDIAVIGVGGVETADDVKLFLDAGASMVQAATLVVRDGHDALDRLAA
jgi:dihydroorotate dehydrogenase subfamily 1